ncbi:hypothetical protein ACIA8O_20005 [Kitasatospora sp. NPDC051853]|uniref:hypothetical protein n=1 Tax=Kitasatospora sp. NPDC051853 TaxID=3364058 RepID=UPI00378B21A5
MDRVVRAADSDEGWAPGERETRRWVPSDMVHVEFGSEDALHAHLYLQKVYDCLFLGADGVPVASE